MYKSKCCINTSTNVSSPCSQVGAKMWKSTRPVYWGRAVITGRTEVGDMLEWALTMCSTMFLST